MRNTAYYQQHLQGELLNLYGCFDGDIPELFGFLNEHSAVQHLNLAYNRLDQRLGIPLLNALATNTTLTNLDLYGNMLNSACMIALADMLFENATIQRINLVDNEIGAQNCDALAAALSQNQQLTTLNLYQNKLGDQGCQALFKGLDINSTLQDIDIGSNAIANAGGEAVRSYLRAGSAGKNGSSSVAKTAHLQGLQRIGLSNNELTDGLKASLALDAGARGIVVEM